MEATIISGRFIGMVFLNFSSAKIILDCVLWSLYKSPYKLHTIKSESHRDSQTKKARILYENELITTKLRATPLDPKSDALSN